MPIYLPTARDAAALRAVQSKQQNMRGAGMSNTPIGVAIAPPRVHVPQRNYSPPQHVLGIITVATGAGGSYTVEAAYLSSASVLTAYVDGDSRHLSVTAQNMAELGSGVANALAVGQAVELFWSYTEEDNSVRMWYFQQAGGSGQWYWFSMDCIGEVAGPITITMPPALSPSATGAVGYADLTGGYDDMDAGSATKIRCQIRPVDAGGTYTFEVGKVSGAVTTWSAKTLVLNASVTHLRRNDIDDIILLEGDRLTARVTKSSATVEMNYIEFGVWFVSSS